jgi:hypothetical protein
MKKTAVSIFLFILMPLLFAAGPEWVSSYGAKSPYPADEYITGFAMISLKESSPQVRSREISLSDLTGKIETKVFSEITMKESDSIEGFTSSALMITRCTVDVTVSGVEYEYYEDRDYLYALAYVSTDVLSSEYSAKAGNIYLDLNSLKSNAIKNINDHKNDYALTDLYKAKKKILDFYEQYSLFTSVEKDNTDIFFLTINSLSNMEEFKKLESEINFMLEEIEDLESSDFREAINKAALILKKQEITAGNLDVPPFNYEQTSFSSAFGRYGAALLESALVDKLPVAEEKTLFRSNYWIQGDTMQLTVLAIDINGQKKAQATVRFPYDSALSQYDFKPQNFEESMIALREFADGALSDGGIGIDIWTNKGRDEDSPIYETGDTLQLYMRVNQPAFLQITYHLATGQKVLLERSYYLGMDQVNRIVKLPYDFEVQPPLGIEQLVVTAFSKEPPAPLVIPEEINGEVYEVFSSMNAVTAQTRGLRRKQDENEIRVGEAIINLMTVEKL